MSIGNKTTESLFLSAPGEIQRGEGEPSVRQSLRDKKFSFFDLLGQIEREADLVKYLPEVKAIVEEFLVIGKLDKKKAVFEKLQLHCYELYIILAAAMEEYISDRNLARLKAQTDKAVAAHLERRATPSSEPKRFQHGRSKRVAIRNISVPDPFKKDDKS